MATASGNFYGEYSKQSRLRLYWEYTQDRANNCDYFYLALYAQKPSGMGTHSNNYHNSKYFLTGFSEDKLINGTGDFTWGNTTEMLIGESSFTHYHDNSGNSGGVYVGGNWFTNLNSSSVVGTNLYVEGTVTGIPSIPRYANFTEHYVKSTGLNSISVRWNADASIDRVQYSLNDSNWYDTAGLDFTLSGLTPNTYYNIRTRIRRADSGLWTESGYIGGTTKDIAKVISASDFNLGDNPKITISNPSGESINYFVETLNPTKVVLEKKAVAGENTIVFTQEELDTIYKKMGTANSTKIRLGVATKGAYWHWQDKTCKLTGNQKTGHVNIKGDWYRSKRWVNVNGTWKRCVRWVNVNGTWKRCI